MFQTLETIGVLPRTWKVYVRYTISKQEAKVIYLQAKISSEFEDSKYCNEKDFAALVRIRYLTTALLKNTRCG